MFRQVIQGCIQGEQSHAKQKKYACNVQKNKSQSFSKNFLKSDFEL